MSASIVPKVLTLVGVLSQSYHHPLLHVTHVLIGVGMQLCCDKQEACTSPLPSMDISPSITHYRIFLCVMSYTPLCALHIFLELFTHIQTSCLYHLNHCNNKDNNDDVGCSSILTDLLPGTWGLIFPHQVLYH